MKNIHVLFTDGEDGWEIVSLHTSQDAAVAAQAAHAAEFWLDVSPEEFAERMDDLYKIEEHALQM